MRGLLHLQQSANDDLVGQHGARSPCRANNDKARHCRALYSATGNWEDSVAIPLADAVVLIPCTRRIIGSTVAIAIRTIDAWAISAIRHAASVAIRVITAPVVPIGVDTITIQDTASLPCP